jgi:hypothetical protein
MIDFSRVILFSDQPTTCPKCGARTEFILDLSHTSSCTQIHKCLFNKCLFEFVVQSEENFIINNKK